MKLELNAENIKELVNSELNVALGEPAWSKYDKDGTPAKDGVPVYDDHRLTEEDKALVEAVVENPEKLTTKEDAKETQEMTVKELYAVELQAKIAEIDAVISKK